MGPTVSFFGAGSGTGNLGVSALSLSVLLGLVEAMPGIVINEFDHGRTHRHWQIGEGSASVRSAGGTWTRRWYRPESLSQLEFCARFGGLWNRGARWISDSAAIMDISGGDSFTDLYGMWRFGYMMRPKLMALRLGIPLLLLPQTYGPYKDARARRDAEVAARGAALAWARDHRSFGVLRELLGNEFDPARHRVGVDVAFRLPVQRPTVELDPALVRLLEGPSDRLVGLNVSGLIWNDPAAMRERYRFRADYRQALLRFVRRVLDGTDASILLMPHVVTPEGHKESDADACRALRGMIDEPLRTRLVIGPSLSDPREAKWVISRCGWFCGTRMHATIAALSTGVPAAAVSYSPKTLGVFDTCRLGDQVIDPTIADTEEVAERMWAAYQAASSTAGTLRESLGVVMETAREQMADVARAIAAAHESRARASRQEAVGSV